MKIIIKVWEFLNSKKTAIGAFILATSDFAEALGYPEMVDPMKKVGYLFTATGLGHKAKKAMDK